jgi:3',5'-cyclic AMP phosphodiesterase CpdA
MGKTTIPNPTRLQRVREQDISGRMTTIRIVQISDSHLSRTHAYFFENWCALLDELRRDPPDMVVHTGDLSFNGADHEDDIVFGRAELEKVPCRWRAIAGNHDVGEAPGFARLGQPVSPDRIARWRRHMGELWWREDIGEWRIIALDTALMASRLAEEEEQHAFLQRELRSAGRRPVPLLLHMPPFATSPEEDSPRPEAIPVVARRPLLSMCVEAGVSAIGCGHQHIYRRTVYRGIEIVWAPTTAMVAIERHLMAGRGVPRPGFVEWRLEGNEIRHRLIEPASMFLSRWTARNGGTVTTLPPLALSR